MLVLTRDQETEIVFIKSLTSSLLRRPEYMYHNLSFLTVIFLDFCAFYDTKIFCELVILTVGLLH